MLADTFQPLPFGGGFHIHQFTNKAYPMLQFNGIKYQTKKELIMANKHESLSLERVKSRMSAGWSFDEALKLPLGTKRPKFQFEFNGKKYADRNSCVVANMHESLNLNAVNARINNGWPLELSMSLPLNSKIFVEIPALSDDYDKPKLWV